VGSQRPTSTYCTICSTALSAIATLLLSVAMVKIYCACHHFFASDDLHVAPQKEI
jgi:hypothetical protein